jgi:hypothetical protein
MNKHLQGRIEQYFKRYEMVILVTCGQAGPQVSKVPYQAQHLHLYLYVPRNADHLFNLETNPELVLFTPTWKLHGHRIAAGPFHVSREWETVVKVQFNRLHILSEDGMTSLETIDFTEDTR